MRDTSCRGIIEQLANNKMPKDDRPEELVDIYYKHIVSENPDTDKFTHETKCQYYKALFELGKHCERIMEIGSYTGVSTKHFAEGIKASGKVGQVIAVDNCLSVDQQTFAGMMHYECHPARIHPIESDSIASWHRHISS